MPCFQINVVFNLCTHTHTIFSVFSCSVRKWFSSWPVSQLGYVSYCISVQKEPENWILLSIFWIETILNLFMTPTIWIESGDSQRFPPVCFCFVFKKNKKSKLYHSYCYLQLLCSGLWGNSCVFLRIWLYHQSKALFACLFETWMVTKRFEYYNLHSVLQAKWSKQQAVIKTLI